jgi:very-short-patch-repair endonuclease
MSALEDTFAGQMRLLGLPEPVREMRFHDTRRWRFDFCWPDRMLAVEVEGGVRSRGRHVRGQGFVDDCEKYNAAALLGWRVLRFPGEWVEDGTALALVEEALS